MSNSILEQIAANVLTTINGVTTVNGATQTIVCIRPAKAPAAVAIFNATLYQTSRIRSTSEPGQHLEWLQAFQCEVLLMPSETDTSPLDAYANSVVADVEKALVADAHRGNLALDTIPDGSDIEDGINGGCALVRVHFTVKYRTRFADPYSQ